MDNPSTLSEQKMAEIKQALSDGSVTEPKERQALLKELVGWKIAARAKDGDVIGLGSGSTSRAAIVALRERVAKEGLQISGVATSTVLAELARQDELIPILVMPEDLLRGATPGEGITWGFDGADEVETSTGRLIKGGGAAHNIERLVAEMTSDWTVIVDESKLVEHLGAFPVPVEIVNDPAGALALSEQMVQQYGATQAVIRQRDGQPVLTDSGNLVMDIHMGGGNVPMDFEEELIQQPGVVERGVGIFTGYGKEIWVARANGDIEVMQGAGA